MPSTIIVLPILISIVVSIHFFSAIAVFSILKMSICLLFSDIPYRILIHSSTKIASSMTSNCWIILSGHIGETEKISIPKGKLEFVFEVSFN